MAVREFIRNVVDLVNANHEFNNELNRRIKELKTQIEEEKKHQQ